MVAHIEIRIEKFLSLKNAVFIKLNDISGTESTINSSISKMKAYGVLAYGPPIIWTYVEPKENQVKLERRLILQCTGDLSKIPRDFEKKEPTRIGPCVYARFLGSEENLVHAFEKISVYSYENEIKLKKENYTVHVKNDCSISTVDVFIPVEGATDD